MKLHELSADVERAVTLTSDLIKALSARHPFQLAYQGVNDRALPDLWRYDRPDGARRFPPAQLASPPGHRRANPPGRCQQRFLSALELEDHLKGWAGQLDRQRRLSP